MRYVCIVLALLLFAWAVRLRRDGVMLGTVWVDDGCQVAPTVRVRGLARGWQRVRFIRRSSLLAPDVERPARAAARARSPS